MPVMKKNAVIGIDIGGTKIAGAVFDPDGTFLYRKTLYLEVKAGKQAGKIIQELVIELLQWSKGQSLTIKGIGASVPGIYYSKTGRVWAPNIPNWENYPFLQQLMDCVKDEKVPVKIDSDRACYILGEVWKGKAVGCSDAIFLAVGTGIGAGILVDGRIVRGANDIAGAIGWMALSDPFLEGYEKYGCFEFNASGDGLARVAKMILKEKKADFQGASYGAIDNLTAKDVFNAYDLNDPNAVEVIKLAIRYWGKAVANLISLFNPEKIIFGGGVFGPAVRFLDEIYLEAQKWAQPISFKQVKLEASEIGGEAGLYGAGYLALNSKNFEV